MWRSVVSAYSSEGASAMFLKCAAMVTSPSGMYPLLHSPLFTMRLVASSAHDKLAARICIAYIVKSVLLSFNLNNKELSSEKNTV
ncbi:hypothetical protein EVAR_41178_1 [Eumeta japonica]|uniref:Uncharacterized protein n=1 Tax=Eumeta variegata TaxID=151549 RepID=A0A4C2A8T7_EUMVA|nr:hypothetical protein EVAR_41178_1 [Eumeta japonica]